MTPCLEHPILKMQMKCQKYGTAEKISLFTRVANIVGIGENAGYQNPTLSPELVELNPLPDDKF